MKHLVLLILLSAATLARADDDDQDRAREAFEHHRILPLAEILAAVSARYGSNIVDIEFEDHGAVPVYEFEIIDDTGQLIEIVVNAVNGAFFGDEGEKD